jgi:hypothetical protein
VERCVPLINLFILVEILALYRTYIIGFVLVGQYNFYSVLKCRVSISEPDGSSPRWVSGRMDRNVLFRSFNFEICRIALDDAEVCSILPMAALDDAVLRCPLRRWMPPASPSWSRRVDLTGCLFC